MIKSMQTYPKIKSCSINTLRPMLRTFRGYLIILAVGLSMAAGVSIKFRHDMDSARRSYINEERYKALGVAKEIEVVFRTVYQGLRIITRLPGVRDIDRHGKNFSQVEHQTALEVYKSIAEIISLSEIYIVTLDFDPYQLDPVTGKLQEPVVMFDELIHGKRDLSHGPNTAKVSHDEPEINEAEIYEYEELVEQLKLFKEAYPLEKSLTGSSAPAAVAGKEILTCDNSRFDPARPDDKMRSGIVYSLPLYNQRGLLKGLVSGTMLSSVLADHLPDANYVLGNKKHAYLVSKRDLGQSDDSRFWYENAERDLALVYSQVIALDIPDMFGLWYL